MMGNNGSYVYSVWVEDGKLFLVMVVVVVLITVLVVIVSGVVVVIPDFVVSVYAGCMLVLRSNAIFLEPKFHMSLYWCFFSNSQVVKVNLDALQLLKSPSPSPRLLFASSLTHRPLHSTP